MSSIVSRSPSARNQSKDAFWMSIRLGSSRTCFRREKLFRATGAATLVVKRNSLPYDGVRNLNVDVRKRRDDGATRKGTRKGVATQERRRGRLRRARRLYQSLWINGSGP